MPHTEAISANQSPKLCRLNPCTEHKWVSHSWPKPQATGVSVLLMIGGPTKDLLSLKTAWLAQNLLQDGNSFCQILVQILGQILGSRAQSTSMSMKTRPVHSEVTFWRIAKQEVYIHRTLQWRFPKRKQDELRNMRRTHFSELASATDARQNFRSILTTLWICTQRRFRWGKRRYRSFTKCPHPLPQLSGRSPRCTTK